MWTPVIEMSTIYCRRSICCHLHSLSLYMSPLNSEIYFLFLNQGKYLHIYHYSLSFKGREIRVEPPAHQYWRCFLEWLNGLEGLKWREIWWTSRRRPEPGRRLPKPSPLRATPCCWSAKGLAGSRCGIPVAVIACVSWQGLWWCVIIFWASSKEWKEWTEVTVVHYQQNNPHSPRKVIILSLWAPVICSQHAQSHL